MREVLEETGLTVIPQSIKEYGILGEGAEDKYTSIASHQ